MIVVLDTNVVVAALRSRRGAGNRLEYESVLTRAVFRLATGYREVDISDFLDDVATVIAPVELTFLWRPQLRDPSDEMVLETAVNAKADLLITFNIKGFRPATRRFETQLATPHQALERRT